MSYDNSTGLPSVTDIVSVLIPIHVRKFVFKKEYATRGTKVHKMCQEAIRTLSTSDLDIDSELIGFKKSLAKWKDFSSIEPIMCEERLTDRDLGFTGQPDLICFFGDRKGLGVIDWKTSKSFYDHWLIQLSAYAHMVEKKLKSPVSWISTVRIRSAGTKPLENISYDPKDIFENKFIPLLNMYKELFI